MRIYIIFIPLLLLGCAITDDERSTRYDKINKINDDYKILVNDCNLTEGTLIVPDHRIANAPPTVWEKQEAWCEHVEPCDPRYVCN